MSGAPAERSHTELLRKLVHTATGLLAFALAFAGPLGSILLAAALVVWNLFVLPRLLPRVWRPGELDRRFQSGIAFYPFVLLVLTVVFQQRLEIAAAVWGVLAFGDGMATIAGGRGRPLPWNPKKTWAGTIAYWVFGTAAAAVLLAWTLHFLPAARPLSPSGDQGGETLPWPFLTAVAAVAVALAALVESQPWKLDDNLTAPPVAALLLLGLVSTQGHWTAEAVRTHLLGAAVALAVNLAAAGAAYAARAIDVPGAVAGTILGTVTATFLGWRGFVVLVFFVAAGTAATKLGYRRKAATRLAQEAGGRRSAKNAVANAGVACAAALFAATTPQGGLYLAAFLGAFSSATADTLSSEIGQLRRGRCVLVTSWQPVAPGTDGGISLGGTLVGTAGAFAVAVLGFSVGFHAPGGIAVVAVAGVFGSFVDSLLGATLERRGLLDNEGVNFLATLAGALVAAGATAWTA